MDPLTVLAALKKTLLLAPTVRIVHSLFIPLFPSNKALKKADGQGIPEVCRGLHQGWVVFSVCSKGARDTKG